MTIQAYGQVQAAFRANTTSRTGPDIVVTASARGEAFAVTRYRRNMIQQRTWSVNTGSWGEWRKLYTGDVLRLATDEDREKFKPDLALAMEES